jgi:3-oxoacyl-[acyl-carrier protein] reductase
MNILITGGSSGLGNVIAKTFAKNSENAVYITYNNSTQNVEKLVSEFQNVKAIKCDFNNLIEVNSLSNEINNLNLDVFINNAYSGESIKTYFHKIPVNEFQDDFIANIIPTVTLTQAAICSFRKNKKSGKIITILTSFLLNTPPTGASIYVANKAYLKSLVNSWATENIKFNITSNSISPAFMQTNFTKDVDERIIEQMIDSHPLKKILTNEEVAESVLFLANSTSQINGIDLVINAGVNIK